MKARSSEYEPREVATYEEIAAAIGLTPNGAEKICKRALRKLRRNSAARELARLAASRDYSELNLREITQCLKF